MAEPISTTVVTIRLAGPAENLPADGAALPVAAEAGVNNGAGGDFLTGLDARSEFAQAADGALVGQPQDALLAGAADHRARVAAGGSGGAV